ncbi:hypothetical protein ACTXT7_008327 [Hymenolepis weldensis]
MKFISIHNMNRYSETAWYDFYKCRNCYEKYRGKQLFKLHVKHEHTGTKKKHFECNRCNGRPRTFYRLLVHYITNHCGFHIRSDAFSSGGHAYPGVSDMQMIMNVHFRKMVENRHIKAALTPTSRKQQLLMNDKSKY